MQYSLTYFTLFHVKKFTKIYDVPMKFASKLIHGGKCTFAIHITYCRMPVGRGLRNPIIFLFGKLYLSKLGKQ